MRSRTLFVALLVLIYPIALRAGGPAYVAGSGYNPGVEGEPLVWANASVSYFTDQAALSPILTNAQADAFVATAISPWTTAPGVGLTVTQSGHLAEDVNGSNILATQGVITAPADITPTATSAPLAIIYDYDGTVTDALLGDGAGSLADCFTNAVYGGPDNFSGDGNIAHAVIVINGVCASTNSQLPDVQYRMVRVLARIFGLGWSQANSNVLTHHPVAVAEDYQGFPVMHFLDPISCVPISICFPNAALPKLDDVTAMARLYPLSGGGSQLTGRVWGSVYFTDSSGNATQPMQGVNVVARLLDNNNQPTRQYVVTSVSGFAFTGNAGNIVNGFVDANGLPWNRFGSGDVSVEGFYDLGELMIPSGKTYALYQLSVEPVDTSWSWGMEPYAPMQVAPSGSFAPVVVTVASGSDSERDILLLGSEIAHTHPGTGSSYSKPAPLPSGGAWGGWISGYGSADFFQLNVQANRTASVAVMAIDETGAPTEAKLLPVIGIWSFSDQSGNPAPAATSVPFNSMTFGMSRLDAHFLATQAYKIGISDYRGDGRPDFAYQASVLYSDAATPARVSLTGGVTTLTGIGFKTGLQVSTSGRNGTVLSQTATALQVNLPPAAFDGTATIQVTDPSNGGYSQMLDALTYGAAADDRLFLLQGSEPATPINAQAANMIRVRATASDGVTPVNGATIAWTSTNGIKFSACNGTTSCSVLTDMSGESATWVIPTATGPGTITAALAPQSYSPPQTQQTTLVGTVTSLDLAAIAPTRWIAAGATFGVPLTVVVLSAGAPQAGVGINYTVTSGTATLSSSNATTNSSGLATVTAQLTNLNTTVRVSACVAPGNSPCQTFLLLAVPATSWTLESVSGTAQVVANGDTFQPLVMRVTDGSTADNPVTGVSVVFLTTLERIPQGSGGPPAGDKFAGQGTMPIILDSSQTQVTTGQDGLAAITPTVGSLGPCDALITVTAGNATAQFDLQALDPMQIVQQQPKKHSVARRQSLAHFRGGPVEKQDVGSVLFVVPQEAALPEPLKESAADACLTTTVSADVADMGSPETTPPTASHGEHHPCPSAVPDESRSKESVPDPEFKTPPAPETKGEPLPKSAKAAKGSSPPSN